MKHCFEIKKKGKGEVSEAKEKVNYADNEQTAVYC
jgi:hypothetical protein